MNFSSKKPVLRRVALRLLAPLAATAALAACDSITSLDESAETFISPDQFYQNDSQAAIAVNGVYAPLMGWNGFIQPAQHSIMCEDNEILCWDWMGGGWSGQASAQWYNQGNSTYFGNYQIIQRANEVMVNVAKSSGVTPTMKNTATGQSLFARGYAYFDLVRRFGSVPIRTEPYRPDAQLGALAPSSVAEVYQQAARDLRQAAELLPASYSTPNGQGLPRAAAAWGLLSKVYLHMAGDQATGTPLAANRNAYLDSARIAAQKVMGDATVRLEQNYLDVFDAVKQNTSPEVLFAVQGSKTSLQGSNVVPMAVPRGDCTLVGGCGSGFLSLREDFYATFERDDKRVEPNKAIAHSWEVTNSKHGRVRALHRDSLATLQAAGLVVKDSIEYGGWTGGCGAFGEDFHNITLRDPADASKTTTQWIAVGRPVYMLKYIDPSSAGGSEYGNNNNIIILRYADVLLIAAEAENELNGPTTAAYNAINAVRARAGLRPLSGLSKEQFRQAVWTERSHELYGEFHGRFDLIREGRWLEVMNQTSKIADFASHGICRPRQAYQKLLPIPANELAANPLMKQNPGY